MKATILLAGSKGVPYAPCSRRFLGSVRKSEEERFGVNIVRRVLEEPLRRIAINAGPEGVLRGENESILNGLEPALGMGLLRAKPLKRN